MIHRVTSNKTPDFSCGSPELDAKVRELLALAKISAHSDEFFQMIGSILKFSSQTPTGGDARQMRRMLKELRHAHRVFLPYRGTRKISVFGSARTHPDRAEYQAAQKFAGLMRDAGYMIITGGGDGIMGAAQAGAGAERSFGLNIQLPFEQSANVTIQGDPKLINFRYFFTRKLNFIKESHAIALFPGGFGTMDEGFEAITLLQTGKTNLMPIVFVDAPGGNFWRTFEKYLREHLLRDGLVSAHDFNLFKFTDNLDEAVREVTNFYYNFHSYRWVEDQLVIRLQRPVPEGTLKRLREDFADVLRGDALEICHALPAEINEPELAPLPRLCLNFDRRTYGRLRQLIDRLNEF
jgi:uncharacterized protein (TIGR00730 family)